MKRFKTTLSALLICLMNLTCSSATHKDDPYQLYIDFLKLEMQYHNHVVYYPFPFEDITYTAKDHRIETNPERIKQRIAERIFYNSNTSKAEYSYPLPVPHRIKIEALSKDRYKAEAFVTLPETSSTLSLGAINIGIPQSFDQLEVTLMRIEGNVAYLLIEDKSELVDYSYTRPDYIFPDQEEDSDNDSWMQEELANPYMSRFDIYSQYCIGDISNFAKDGFQYFTRSRMSGIAYNVDGKQMEFETFIEDFRHYLWYRNMDMPYAAMKDDYRTLQERFPTSTGDCRYYTQYVVRLEAVGRISNLNLDILSSATQPPLHLQWEEDFAYNYYLEQPTLEEMTARIASIKNLDSTAIASKLTVTPYAIRNSKLEITAFLPASYNTQYGNAALWFNRLTFPFEEDSYTMEQDIIPTESFDADYLWQSIYGSALKLTAIPLPKDYKGVVTGEVKYYYPLFEGARYDVYSLPEGLHYENDTLFISKKKTPAHEEDYYDDDTDCSIYYGERDYHVAPSTLTAYDEAGRKLDFEEVEEGDTYKLIFPRPAKAFISIWRKDSFKGTVPFSIQLQAPQNN